MLHAVKQLNGRGRPDHSTEDFYAVEELSGISFFAVFDGHGGKEAADYTSKTLLARLTAALPPFAQAPLDMLRRILITQFVEHDKELYKRRQTLNDSGCTATVAIVTPKHIIITYLGDSPAFLFSPSGTLVAEIGRHEPDKPKERNRIQTNGGYVAMDSAGTPRVDGNLMVSRAFGDFSLKWREGEEPVGPNDPAWSRMKVSSEPDIVAWPRPAQGYLVLASDGLAENPGGSAPLRTGQEMAAMVHQNLQAFSFQFQPALAQLMQMHIKASSPSGNTAPSKYRGDDTTIILVNVGTDAVTEQIGVQGGTVRTMTRKAPRRHRSHEARKKTRTATKR